MKLKRKDENYDYSELDRYFEEMSEVSSVIKRLIEMRISYMELSLCLERQISGSADMSRMPEAYPHDEAIHHSELLGDIIKILGTVAGETMH